MKNYLFIALLTALSTSAFASEVCEVGTKFYKYRDTRLAVLKCSNNAAGDLGFYKLWVIDTDASPVFGLGNTQGSGFEQKDSATLKQALVSGGFTHSFNSPGSETWIKN